MHNREPCLKVGHPDLCGFVFTCCLLRLLVHITLLTRYSGSTCERLPRLWILFRKGWAKRSTTASNRCGNHLKQGGWISVSCRFVNPTFVPRKVGVLYGGWVCVVTALGNQWFQVMGTPKYVSREVSLEIPTASAEQVCTEGNSGVF